MGCRALEELVLRCCRRVTLQGVRRVAEGAPLRRLDLWGCADAVDADVRALAAAAPALLHLSLRGCGVGDAAVVGLARHCPDLQTLDLCGCPAVSDASVKQLVRCRALAKLDLWGCGVTARSEQVLRKACPKLKLELAEKAASASAA